MQQPQQPSPIVGEVVLLDRWTCPQCQMVNGIKDRNCFVCDLAKPNDPGWEQQVIAEKAKRDRLWQLALDKLKYEHEGQGWACTNCNSLSRPDVFECVRCGGIRPYKTPEEKQALVLYLKAKKARLLAETTANTTLAEAPTTPTPSPPGARTPNRRTGGKPMEYKADGARDNFQALGTELSTLVVPMPHSGVLQMLSEGLLGGTLKDRYCEIRGPYLYYFKVRDEKQPKGRIVLNEPGTELYEEPQPNMPYRFRIHSSIEKKDFIFNERNSHNYAIWINKIREATAICSQMPKPYGLYKVGEGGDYKELILFPSNDPLSRRRFELNDFELLKLVGKGSFGHVLKVRNKVNNQIMAMKILRKEAITKPKEVLAEKAVLQVVDHPFIVKLFGAFQTHSKLFLVMSYLPGGDVKLHLRRHGHFRENRAKFYAAQLVLMLECLHDHMIVYRDLKPENLVIDADGYLVLTDMGLARDMTDETQLKTFCGTPMYMAPELVNKKGYDKGVDWWAFGIILYEMLVGVSPFTERSVQAVFHLLRTADVTYPEGMSPLARDLLERVLVKDPQQRLTNASDIKAHCFFADVDWQQLLEKKAPPPQFWKAPEPEGKGTTITPEQAAFLIRDQRSKVDLTVDSYLGFSFCHVTLSDDQLWQCL